MTLNKQCVQKMREKNVRYIREQRREKNKIRRVLKSSGLKEAKRYASANNLKPYLQGIAKGE